VALAVLTGSLWCAPAGAQQADPDREWSSARLFENRTDLWTRTSWAEVGPAGAVVLWDSIDGGPLRAAFRPRGGGLDPEQVLAPGRIERHAVAGSANGGALAVWFAFGAAVRYAEIAPGARTFSAPETLAEDAQGYPAVAMNERGDAALLYRTEDGLWLRRRPAGGALRAAELVATDDDGWPATLSVGPDGSVVVAYLAGDRLFVRVGRRGEALGPRSLVGSPLHPGAIGYNAVGIDAAGNAVVAWLDWNGDDQAGPLWMAFKARDAAGFGPPRATGIDALSLDPRDLVVTASGELIVVVQLDERPSGKPVGGYEGGSVAFFGDTRRQLIGPPTTLTTDIIPPARVGANERGDAVVVYSAVTWGADGASHNMVFRRRAPHGSFGAAYDYRPPPAGGYVYYREAEHPQLDSFGNAQTLWWHHLDETYGSAPYDISMAQDGPLLTEPLPPVGPSDGPLPPVLEPDPAPPLLAPTDTAAPRVRLRIERRVRGRYAFARVRCSERCSLRLRHGVASVAKRATEAKLSAGRERRLRLRLTTKTVRSLRHSRRGRKLRVELQARDAAGNTRRIRRTARVRAASTSRRASGDPR
jgi:hypothetical protein